MVGNIGDVMEGVDNIGRGWIGKDNGYVGCIGGWYRVDWSKGRMGE